MTDDKRAVSREEPVITTSRSPLHRAAGTGAMYLALFSGGVPDSADTIDVEEADDKPYLI